MLNKTNLLSAVLLILFLIIFAVHGQNIQTVFNLEESVGKPTAIPEDILAVLKSDKRVDICFKEKSEGANETEWFEASEIDLNNDKRNDLIVKAKDSCLFGANQGPFWIFQNRKDGWQKILSATGLQLTVLPKKKTEFNPVKIGAVVSMKPVSKTFYFRDGKYQ